MANSDYTINGSGNFATTAKLSAPIGLHDTVAYYSGLRNPAGIPVAGDAVMVGEEIMRVASFSSGFLTLDRGCMDTIPQTHERGETLWFMKNGVGTNGVTYLNGEDIGVKALPRTASRPNLSLAQAPALGLTFNQRFARPYPPGRFRLNDVPFSNSYRWNTSIDLVVTWAHRNRLTQADQLVGHEATSVAPEDDTTYTVAIMIGEIAARSVSGITGDSFTYTKAMWIDDETPASFTLVLKCERDGIEGWQFYSVDVPTVSPPFNTVAPTITGAPSPGNTLNLSNGTWLNSPDSYTYRWYEDGDLLVGETANTYEIPDDPGEIGKMISADVIATNEDGESEPAVTSAVEIISSDDPHFANVVLLVHGLGADESTAIVDSSGYGRTLTLNGNTRISTVESIFDGSSIAMDGAGDNITFADVAEMDLGTGDFTVEAWVNFNNTTDMGLLGGGPGSYDFAFVSSTMRLGRSYTAWDQSATFSRSTDVWYHVAWSRVGTTLGMFVNGTQISSETNGNAYNVATTGLIGQSTTPSDRLFNGYIDELRVTKGVGRYTITFTPPAGRFPNA